MIPTLLLLFRCWDTGVEPEPPPPQRPVVVLLDRGDRTLSTQAAVWLRTATGAARDHIDAVTLVWETPAQVAEWTQAPVPDEDGIVLVDLHTREQTGHAALHLLPKPPPQGAPDPFGRDVWPQQVVRAFDTALQEAVGDLLAGPLVRQSPPVVGATRCSYGSCGGMSCDDRAASSRSFGGCGMGQVDYFTSSFLMRWPPEDRHGRHR